MSETCDAPWSEAVSGAILRLVVVRHCRSGLTTDRQTADGFRKRIQEHTDIRRIMNCPFIQALRLEADRLLHVISSVQVGIVQTLCFNLQYIHPPLPADGRHEIVTAQVALHLSHRLPAIHNPEVPVGVNLPVLQILAHLRHKHAHLVDRPAKHTRENSKTHRLAPPREVLHGPAAQLLVLLVLGPGVDGPFNGEGYDVCETGGAHHAGDVFDGVEREACL